MTTYGTLKSIWAAALPGPARRAIWRMSPQPLRRIRARLVGRLERSASHDEIYDARYYRQLVEPTMAMSAERIADTIDEVFGPATVVDVGCGSGRLLESLKRRSVEVLGLDHSKAAVDMCRARGVPIEQFDLEHDAPRGWRGDLVVCTEVAEHLPPCCADPLVDLLTSISHNVLITAAEPGRGGTDHVNEQPTTYWIEKFRVRGYRFERAESLRIRREWSDAGVAGCFASTLMIFRRSSNGTTPAASRDAV